ncbi:PLP-dependent aminotransferase family protein [Herminiimonas fonticola]|uniref:GntR family transcriptional regulator n=1 Tax=Herminiimonas fonticola TaxID=303380 RepID=A0A4R6G3Q9_9BURK|nr:PLP-dependent aminotransferase family protein [Herminiimonas fonticola]RBA23329.1 Transcriptional regulator (MocR family) [Herminiimonas fonticola]TDN89046.1 GntR family transcriptional regulator [Herminiimonas fonticola]
MPKHQSIAPSKFEALAQQLQQQIAAGVLRPGDRLPSVRQICATRHLSPSTVFQAYYLLESRGLIHAVPRSGYFVAARAGGVLLAEPRTSDPQPGSQAVEVNDLICTILGSALARDIVPLGSAFLNPALFPLDRLRRALVSSTRRLKPWNMVDDLPPGNLRLRREIAKRYLRQGMAVDPDEIVLTNGAMEALNLCLGAVARPGDAVVVESPTFYIALQALQHLGLHAIEVPTHVREGIDLGRLAQVIELYHPKACWLMTTFQNPLGSLMPDTKKRDLVELLARHDIPLIEDDVYSELYEGKVAPLPAKAFDHRGLVLHCSSFSKCLAPGYRVGWAAPGRWVRDVQRLKVMTSLSGSIPAQAALAEYLQAGGYDHHLRGLRLSLQAQRASLFDAVTRNFPDGTLVVRPAGGYFMWLELPIGVDAMALYRAALAQGISIAPGPMFSARAEFQHHIRLTCGQRWDAVLERATRTLARLVSDSMHANSGVPPSI